uniref:MARVEL domain-containing protein n=1 Tax=Syphacia muris TaxID=451379 RepID=A0A158R5K5_9BILA
MKLRNVKRVCNPKPKLSLQCLVTDHPNIAVKRIRLASRMVSAFCCCCASCKGAYIIAFISGIFILTNFVLKAVGISDIGWNWELLFLFVDLLAVACLVGGLWTERPALLQPFVVLSIITISFLILLILFFASAVYDSHSYAGEYIEMELGDRNQQAAELLSVQQKNVVQLLSSFVVVALTIAAVIHIWFLILIVQCAQYLRDMRPFKVRLIGFF